MKADDPSGTAVDDPGGSAVGANVGDASPAAVSSLSAPTTSSSRIPPLHANGMSNNMSTEMTVMSKLEALESSWDFSVLHEELDFLVLRFPEVPRVPAKPIIDDTVGYWLLV